MEEVCCAGGLCAWRAMGESTVMYPKTRQNYLVEPRVKHDEGRRLLGVAAL